MKFFRSVLVIFIIFSFGSDVLSEPDTQAPQASGVVIKKVAADEISRTSSFIGLLKFDRISRVSTEIGGLVNQVFVQQGEQVKKGQALLNLDTQLLKQEIASARANMAKIDVNIKKAKQNFDRLGQLYEQKLAPQTNYEDAMYNWQSLIHEKSAAEAALKKLEITLEKSSIKAPFDALVLNKNKEAGDWASPGQPLYEIASMQDIYVQVPVPETVLQYARKGTRVNVTVTAYNRDKKGVIYAVEPSADLKTKNVNIKVKIDCSQDLAENMSAKVQIPVSEKMKLMLIPRDALVKFQGSDFIYTVEDGKAKMLKLNIAAYLGDMVGVDDPYITPGMPVIVEGNERLRPDSPVKVAGEK